MPWRQNPQEGMLSFWWKLTSQVVVSQIAENGLNWPCCWNACSCPSRLVPVLCHHTCRLCEWLYVELEWENYLDENNLCKNWVNVIPGQISSLAYCTSARASCTHGGQVGQPLFACVLTVTAARLPLCSLRKSDFHKESPSRTLTAHILLITWNSCSLPQGFQNCPSQPFA